MSGSISGAPDFSSTWGEASTTDLIAYAASVAPDTTVFDGPTGPVTFAALHTQVSATATVLAAQGLDPQVAVNAALTPTVAIETAGDPAKLAAGLIRAVADLRDTALATAGASDLRSLPGIFRAVARRFPERLAVSDTSGSRLTYGELDAASDSVARALVGAGVGNGDVVAIALPREADLVVAVLGILKAGAAYLPLDLAHPEDRLAYVASVAQPRLILAEPAGAQALGFLDVDCRAVGELVAEGQRATQDLPDVIAPSSAAYLIFTSGSTGRPKGVVVEHREVIAMMRAVQECFAFDERDVWTLFHSYAFDFSVFELWGALLFGGRVVVIDHLTTRSPREFAELLADEGATVVSQTPSAFYQLATSLGSARSLAPSVRYIVFGGEALDFAQVRRWYADRLASAGEAGPTLVNMYGITETTVHASFRALNSELVASAPGSDVGAALPGSTLHLLDDRLARVPDGVPGEIYVSGPQITRGYLGQPALTAGRFVADPFSGDGTRMYRSGDLGIYRDGSLMYLGRSDTQVQLRGFRVELGEVESALLSVAGVAEAAAAVIPGAGGVDRLVGYVVAVDENSLDPAVIRRDVGSIVPSYMVPDIVMPLRRLPLTVNGKLDRRALPEPVVDDRDDYAAPANEIEDQLATIVGEVLGLERVSVTASVFDMGGNSLLAARIVGRACEVLGVDVNMRDIFAEPTVRGLSAKVGDMGAALAPLSAANERPERVPLSLAQERMWFINRFDPDAATYNVPLLLRVTGDLDLIALRAAMEDVVARHEVLRTSFIEVDGVGIQQISPVADIGDRLDWRTAASQEEFAAGAAEGFDVTAGWPIRVLVWAAGPGEHVVGVIVHHIAADGESMSPLVGDLMTAYSARSQGAEPSFVPLEVQFADFALWQRQVLGDADDTDSVLGRQLSYWRTRLAGIPELLALPTDHARPATASHRGGQVEFEIPSEVADRVTRLGSDLGATPFMVVHAALAVLLARLSATDDIVIGTPIAGRGSAALDPLVGMFVNTLVLRTLVDPDESFSALVTRTRADDLDAFANSDLPFEVLVHDLNPSRSEAFAPLTQVTLSFDPAAAADTAGFEVAGLSIGSVSAPFVPAHVDLTIVLRSSVRPGNWRGSVIYATDLFDGVTVEALAGRFVRLLDALTVDPAAAVGDAGLLGGAERAAVLAFADGPEVSGAGPLLDQVLAVAAANPGGVAVTQSGVAVTYGELVGRADWVAERLRASGVGVDDVVVLALDRSVRWVVGMLAVWKVGAAYAPVDPAGPVRRIVSLVEDAGAVAVVVESGGLGVSGGGSLFGSASVVVVGDEVATESFESVRVPVGSGSRLGYVITTSGSTGRPKPTLVPLVGIENTVRWYGDEAGLSAGQGVLVASAPTFDLTQKNVWAPLACGGTVHLADPLFDPVEILGIVADYEVAVVNMAPSAFGAVAEVDRGDLLAGVSRIFLGGEVVRPAALRPLLDAGVRVFNSYGPTETSDVVSCHEMTDSEVGSVPVGKPASGVRVFNCYGPTEASGVVSWNEVTDSEVGSVPVGRPIPGVRLYVLDSRLQPVPVGVAGELYIGGVGVGRGYGAMSGRTAASFVADPFAGDGSRLYRTGDLVRWTAGGEVDFLGRADFQIKLRGLRIEIGEIESVLTAVPGVVHAAVTVVELPGGGEHLAAFVAPSTVDLAAVKAATAENLPDYMRPSVWTLLDEVVLNPAGKLDRRALPEPDLSAMRVEYEAPIGEAEQKLAAVFAGVLGVDRVGATESFFEGGGDSLSAIRLVARASAALGAELTIRDLFGAPTVRALAALSEKKDAALPPLRRAQSRPETIPLSFAQQRMWFINQLDPSSSAYSLPSVLRVEGSLDLPALHSAAVDVGVRHEILRTTFPAPHGEPTQVIAPEDDVAAGLSWEVVHSDRDFEERIVAGFDVTREWPFRLVLWSPENDRTLVAVVAHHIAADGESMLPLLGDLFAAYGARVNGQTPRFAPLQVQFADFALWQHHVLGSPADPDSRLGRQLTFWRSQLAGSPGVLELPGAGPRPKAASHRGATLGFEIPAAVAERIRIVASAHDATPFMVLHAALAALLSRLAGTDDISIATPVAGRGDEVLDPLIGMFVNTLVLRLRVDPAEGFGALLRQARTVDLAAMEHSDVPFESVVEALDPVRSEAFEPLAQVMLNVDPGASAERAGFDFPGLAVTVLDPPSTPAQFDLTIGVKTAPDGDSWSGTVIYATDLFDKTTAAWLCELLVDVLDALVSDVDAPVGDSRIINDAMTAEIAARSVGPTVRAPSETVADAVAAQVARTPEATALVFEGRQVSYAEFGARVDTLAGALIARGVGPETAVGVCMERGVDLVVAIHAIVASGAQYVPVGTDSPVDRIQAMVETAGVRLMLVAGDPRVVADVSGVELLELDTNGEVAGPVASVTAAERTARSSLDNAVYTLFTSGSTGTPKGVTVSGAALANRLAWMRTDFGITSEDTLLLKTPYTFDVSVWELFLPLTIGATLVVARPDGHRDPHYLARLIEDERVSVVHFVPSMLAIFEDIVDARVRELTMVRVLFTSGEPLPVSLARLVLKHLPSLELVNLYGPTEAAIDVTSVTVTRGSETVTIGKPVANTGTWVLDSRLNIVPVGVPGELYLSGVQLARGYAARADLTAERFVAAPFGEPGERLYRTGDLVRWTETGELDYLGRADFQVKLRGQRVELGEIEAVLSGVPDVVHAAVTVATSPDGGDHLVAYLAGGPGVRPDPDRVRAAAAEVLPGYMVPTVWTVVETFVLNTAGKIDRKSLPAPEFRSESAESVPPANRDEALVAEAFAELLGIEQLGVTESFFDAGGNSLSAMRAVARAGEVLGATLTVRDLFDAPSVRELVTAVAGRGLSVPPLQPQPRPARIPVSRAQRRMWVLNQLDPGSGAYNIPLAARLPHDVDEDVLRLALLDVIARHEVLRTVYPSEGAEPYQDVLSDSDAPLRLDWARAQERSELIAGAVAGFDVRTELPIRGRVRRTSEGVELMLAVHHIAFDGESTPILLGELMTAYADRISQGGGTLPPLPLQYADYALWQRDALGDPADPATPLGRQLGYWTRRLAGLPELTELPMDRARPAVADMRGDTVSVPIDDALATRFEEHCRRRGMTPFMVSFAALAVTVSRLAATPDVVLAVPTAGRSSAALDRLIGMFVNTLILRTDAAPGRPIEDFLGSVREEVLSAFDNAEVQFDDLVEALAPARSSAYAPLAQIAFGYRDDVPGLAEVGEGIEPMDVGNVDAKFDLTVGVQGRGADRPMQVELVYATALFDEASVRRIAAVYLRVLGALLDDPRRAIGDIDVVGSMPTPAVAGGPKNVRPVGGGGSVDEGTLLDVLNHRELDPTHPALILGDTCIDYADFERRTDRVAQALLARGVRPDDVVAVALERSIESVVAVWGIVKSGAACLSIDPAYPQARVDYMLDDSGVELGITAPAFHERLGRGRCQWLGLAELEDGTRERPVEDADRNGSLRRDNLAYVIYTSGSTGRPKGVAVSHAGIADLVANYQKVTGEREDDPDTRILHVASPSFDASFFEMAWAITAGHTLVVAPHASFAGEPLEQVLAQGEVTDMVITPSVLATLDPDRAEYVRNLATAGEACPPELVERWSARGRRLFNFYGPSETTVWATRARMLPGKPVTIGRAISGFAVRVLDHRLHEVPQGVVGEMYLSADGLARGYLGRPGQTAARFVADPFGPAGARMYATGDLVRVNGKGDLEFTGRADDQVKINGQRVELGEIEAVLHDLPGVAQAVVAGYDGAGDARTRTRLVAYLTARPGSALDTDVIASAAAAQLAAHMVPAQFVRLDALPLTPGGKLDRSALPSPDDDSAPYAAPEGDTEQVLAHLVGGLLGIERVSVTESFFALGGDSIASIKLASAAGAAGLDLTPREIFEDRTVRAMARRIGAGAQRCPVLPEPEGGARGTMPLPSIVSWMIAASDRSADFADFNQAAVLNAPATLTVASLEQILAVLVAAHPLLTAQLVRGDDGAWSMTAGATAVGAQRVSERHVAARLGTAEFDAALVDAHADAVRGLEPARAELVRAAIVRGEDGARVVLAVHHLGVDAVSWPILFEDLATAWNQWATGQPITLRPEVTSGRAWFTALSDARRFEGEADYWLERLPEVPTVLDPATDLRRRTYADTEVLRMRVESETARSLLTTVPDAFSAGTADVLAGTLARAVRSWQARRGVRDDRPVTLLTEGHGRDDQVLERGADPHRADLSRSVGWFTAVSPLRIDPGTDVVHAVKAAKEERLRRPSEGLGFGVLRAKPESELARRPLPSIALNYLGGRGGVLGGDSESVGDGALMPVADAPTLPGTVAGGMAVIGTLAVDVAVAAGEQGSVLDIALTFPASSLSGEDIRELSDRWHTELEAVVAAVTAGPPGLSPSDVPGAELTQTDLDGLAGRFPGADIWPLTPLQRGLYFESSSTGTTDVDVYVTQVAVTLGGDVDSGRLKAAAEGLLREHPALRSGFVATGAEVVAVVPVEVDLPWREVDLSASEDVVIRAEIERIAADEQVMRFDLASPPLLRAVLVRGETSCTLVITNHHLLFDGWSGPLVLADLLSLYAEGRPFVDRSTNEGGAFGEFVRRIAAADREEALTAWREVLAKAEEPTLVARAAAITSESLPRNRRASLGTETTAAVQELARRREVTVATVLQAAWALVLHRMTGNRVVVFGETVSGRPADLPEADTTVGLFINTLPVAVDTDSARSVAELLADVQRDKVRVLDHQHIGLAELAGASGHPVLFDTLTVYESYPIDTDGIASATAGVSGMTILGIESEDATHYPLTLATAPSPDGIGVTVKYLPDLFTENQIDVLTRVYSRIVRAMADDPEQAVGEIAVLSQAEEELLCPVTVGPPIDPVLLPDIFSAAVHAAPDRVAVVDGDGVELTYAQLDERSDRLARWLLQRGSRAETLIALALPRSADLLTAIWAVAKTGAGYVPIDPEYPASRVSDMIADSGARIGLCRAATRPAADSVDWFDVDDPGVTAQIAALPAGAITATERRAPVRAANTAYVIYTSGSTGRPKGVAVTHSGLANFAHQEAGRLRVAEAPVVLGFASPSFDASVLEYLLATVKRGTLVYRPAGAVGGAALEAFMREHRVTHTFLTPAVLATLDPAVLPDLVAVAAGGEAVPAALVAPWSRHRSIHNLYGPTETTIGITISEPMRAGAPVRLGRPIGGVGLAILDDRLRPVPEGFPGELYVVGPALSRGYRGAAGLTAERFVASSFGTPGERMYRTGDIVRWVRDDRGELVVEYSGRSDDQVKLRGLRIELGEIEAVLSGHPEVRSAVVVPVGDQVVTALAAYVVGNDGIAVTGAELRSHVGSALPSHMVPASVTILDEFPRTPVGKLDKKALPEPTISVDGYVEPENSREERLAEAVAEILGIHRVSVTASFFDLGGNSLSAMRLAGAASEILSADLSVREVFEASSVRELVRRSAGQRPALAPITRISPRPNRIPLSFAQQRMWFLNRLDPDAPTYNVPVVLRLSGEVNAAAMRAAVADTVRRHEVLRTVFPAVDGVPVQLIAPEGAVDPELSWIEVDTVEDFQAAVAEGFDVAVQWPIRAVIHRVGDDDHLFAVVVHHIGTDGESMLPLLTDVLTAYAARAAGEAPHFAPLEVQLADFALWQHQVLGSPDDPESVVGRQIEFWREALAGVPDALDLPADRPRPAVASHVGARVDFAIPATTAERIRELTRGSSLTPFMVVHAGLSVLLSRMSATDDITIATPIAGRGQTVLAPLVGMFVNTLVLRVGVASGMSFSELLEQVRSRDLDAFAHAEVPFEAIVEALDPVRSESFSPLAQVMLSFDPAASAEQVDVQVAGLTAESVPPPVIPAQFDLSFTVSTAPSGEQWRGSVIYATDLFDGVTVEALAGRFVRLLDALTVDPAAAVGDAGLLGGAERAAVLAFADGPEVSGAGPLLDQVLAVAAANPGGVAVTQSGVAVTYGELVGRADWVAERLRASGVGVDDVVVLALDRSVRWVVGMLAVWKVGAAYAPVDPAGPVRRIVSLVEDAGAVAVVVESGGLGVSGGGSLFGSASVVVVGDEVATESFESVRVPAGSGSRLGYVITTSGSTGRPKPTLVPLVGIENTVRWYGDEAGLSAGQGVLVASAPTFDLTQKNVWAPLACGGTVHLADPLFDPVEILGIVADYEVAVVNMAPSAFGAVAEVDRGDLLAGVSRIFLGGETFRPAELRPLLDAGVRVFNGYGPTETSDVASCHEMTDSEVGSVPVGRPIPGVRLYVLDSRLQPVPVGVAGELYIGGVGVGRGYGAMSGRTAASFVADPFAGDGSRLYRTGDLVRWTAGGEVDFLGRADFQIKLRGLRIEIGEIESVLTAAPGVTRAAVIVATGPDGREQLAAYLAPDTIDLDSVRSAAVNALPGYMVPSSWNPVPDIALNASGKVDRRALPEPVFAGGGEYVGPRDDAEARVAEVFAGVLGIPRVSVTESFFDVGGNSLAAMRLASRVSDALGVQVSVRDVFDAPTVRELVRIAAGQAPALPSVTPVVPRPETIPLSFAQQRMWFINRLNRASAAYNIPVVLRLSGSLDVHALRAAVVDVVVRHEVLRTTFPAIDGAGVQVIHPAGEAVERVDWGVVESGDDLVAAVSAGFDVSSQWPIRVRLWPIGERDYALALVTHHIASDGESARPFVRDLVAAYFARAAGEVPQLPDLPVQFADYALWQHRVLGSSDDPESVVGRQLAYWREHLAGIPDVLELPTDRARPVEPSGRGGRVGFAIPAAVGAKVRDVARDRGTTEFMVIHAVLAVLLARLTGTRDIVIGTPVAGRGQTELDELVGMFVNTLVLRTDVPSGARFFEVLETARESDTAAFAHADVPFEVLVEALDPVRSTAFEPLAQVWLTFGQGGTGTTDVEAMTEQAGLRVAPYETGEVPAKVDLIFGVDSAQLGDDWSAGIDYAADLFDRSTVEFFAEAFVRLLSGFVDDPEALTGEAALLSSGQRRDLLPVSGGTGEPAVGLGAIFAEAARTYPDRVAVVDGTGERLTYRELDERSDRLAIWLTEQGVGAETLVAVAIPRSVTLLTAIWAVAKTGGGYVPVDPDYPPERVSLMVADCGARLGLSVAAAAAALPNADFQWVNLDEPGVAAELSAIVGSPEARAVHAAHVAYVIYTSGSTGRPKGVSVTHSGVANWAAQESRGLDTGGAQPPVVLGFASPSFDASVLEYLLATVNGGTLVYRQFEEAGGERLEALIRRHGVTHTFLTPSVLATMDPARVPSLCAVAAGGEAVPPAIVDSWAPLTRLHNLYGPTETTIGVTISAPLVAGEPVVLGPPIPGVGLQVLDDRLQPVPVGVSGELYVVGGALSRGYHRQAALTAERFVADPNGGGQLMYRTGDLVRWRRGSDGRLVLEYSGRTDDQVKLRGLRIELGEIEAVLASYPGVEAAVVVGIGGSAATSLAGYVVAAQDLDRAALRDHAKTLLPSFMVPTALSVLAELPLTPVGKLDKNALPEPEALEDDYVEPEGPVESAVAAVFAEVLGVDRIGATTSFFDAGGNSLSAVRARSLLTESGFDVDLAVFFSDPTPRALAREMSAGEESVGGVLLPLRTAGDRPPLFAIHPAGGLAWFYGGLAPYLQNRPIFGLQDPHVVLAEPRREDAEELAERYLAEIRRIQPTGPYHLLGWSVGGVIAHALAVRIQASGDTVAYLGVMDSAVAEPDGQGRPESEPVRRGADGAMVADLLGGWRELFDLGDDVTASSPGEVAAVVREQIAGLGLIEDAQVERIMDSFASANEVVDRYRPQVVTADLHVFTATADKDEPERVAASWRPYVTGEIVNVDVDTHHLGMADASSLAVIGPELEQRLALLEE